MPNGKPVGGWTAEEWQEWQRQHPTEWTGRMVTVFHAWLLRTTRLSYADYLKQFGSEEAKKLEDYWLTNIYPTLPELAPGYNPDLEPTPAEKKKALELEATYKQEAESYLNQLNMLLSARERVGLITGEEAERIGHGAAGLVKQKEDLSKLPFYTEAISGQLPEKEVPSALRPKIPTFELPGKVTRQMEVRQPEYERIMAETEVPGAPRPWAEWFQSKYGEELARFRPPDIGKSYMGWAEKIQEAYKLKEKAKGRRDVLLSGLHGRGPVVPIEKIALEKSKIAKQGKTLRELLAHYPALRAERSWAEFLKKRIPELEQEYANLYPFGRGGQPGKFAPPIRMV